jgi:hypothetical protein
VPIESSTDPAVSSEPVAAGNALVNSHWLVFSGMVVGAFWIYSGTPMICH